MILMRNLNYCKLVLTREHSLVSYQSRLDHKSAFIFTMMYDSSFTFAKPTENQTF